MGYLDVGDISFDIDRRLFPACGSVNAVDGVPVNSEGIFWFEVDFGDACYVYVVGVKEMDQLGLF